MPQNVHLALEKLALAFLDELKSVMTSYLHRNNMLEMSVFIDTYNLKNKIFNIARENLMSKIILH